MITEARPTSREIVVEGMRLHYLEWGDPKNPTIVMLHGVTQQAHSWDFVAMDLCSDYHILALDQRGHGDSDWAPNGDYSPEASQRDISGFIDQLGIAPCIMIGLSMGGGNAVRYTANNLDKVRGLVVVDIGPQVREQGSKEIRDFVERPDELDFEEFVQNSHRFNPLRSIESLRGSLRNNLKQLPNGKWTWKYDKHFRRRPDDGERQRPDLWPFVHKLKLPVMIVRGDKSHVFAEEDAQAFLAALDDKHYVVIPDASHTVAGDQPVLFAKAVREWLDDRNLGATK